MRAARSPRIAATLAGFAGAGALSWACATSSNDAIGPEPRPAESGSFSVDAGSKKAPPAGEVFGHSDNTLFRVDTTTRTVSEIGFFEGCTYVADIALDESSNIYASTGTELFYVETNTARCTRISQGSFPNSLSFVPAGTVFPDREALVGFQGSDYVQIDPRSGVVTKLGAMEGGFTSSGDVVSARGGKTFVTIKGKDCADCLAEIDPVNGSITKSWGPIGRADVFGLAFWAGELFAFTNGGELLLISLTGDVLDAKALPIANAPAGLKFWGAGSTTSAPIAPVK